MTPMPGYLIVTDYLPEYDETTDLSGAIQKIIDENPHRTIYFPDGIYPLGASIYTPADPDLSVDLVLSRYAILRALPTWKEEGAMVRLSGKHPANDISRCGSNYGLSGGIIDGSGIAKAISIDGGRETRVQDTSIKNTPLGLHIMRGANSGSSDADILDVHIVGNGAPDSIGVLIEGFDNSLTNMRVANVQIGYYIKSNGNFLRHLHPLYYLDERLDHAASVGFLEEGFSNFYTNCYSDQFATAFLTTHGKSSVYDSCFAYWYSPEGGPHTAFKAMGKFRSVVNTLTVGFGFPQTDNRLLEAEVEGGDGVLANPVVFMHHLLKSEGHLPYLQGNVVG